MSLQGTFYPLEDSKQAGSLYTIKVLVDQKEWLFKIKNTRDLNGSLDRSQLLHNISPPILKFRGPKNIIGALQDPTLSGKPVVIEGLLYFGAGIIQVTSESVEKSKS